MDDRICPCGQLIVQSGRARTQKFCSKKCRSQSAYRTHPKDDSEKCKADGCTRRRATKELCLAHYSAVSRRRKTVTIVCKQCGNTADIQLRPGRSPQYCSLACGSAAYNAFKKQTAKSPPRQRQQIPLKQCEWCFQLHQGRSKYCNDEQCIQDRAKQKELFKASMKQSMLFRSSFECGDYATFFQELKMRCVVDKKHGCWVWQRRLKNGYPVQKWSNKQVQVHRLSLEAKHGRPLGSQVAHHKCANSSCVNPNHLQPVTHRDNNAEMMQRRTYLDRIAELENALAEIDPSHPLLDVIEVT